MVKIPAPKESDIQKQILDYLLASGVFAWRNFNAPQIHGNGFFTKSKSAGSPDIMGILPCGKSLQIEVKRNEKAKRSKEQIEWIEKAKKNNAIALFSWDIKQITALIEPCLRHCANYGNSECFHYKY